MECKYCKVSGIPKGSMLSKHKCIKCFYEYQKTYQREYQRKRYNEKKKKLRNTVDLDSH